VTDDTVPSNSSTPPEKYAGDPRWELVDRVASSTVFRKSPRLRQFLFFVTERSIAGHSDEISEYEIGWKVFERGPNYNPMDDSIVRSAARQLRSKVKEYFETEGVSEKLILDIPKGGYIPVFAEREHLAASLNLSESAQLVDEHLAVVLRRWKILTAVLSIGIVALVGFELWKNSVAFPTTRRQSIVSTLLIKDHPTRVILGDSGIAYVSQATKHPLSVAEYANHAYPTLAIEPSFQQIWDRLTDGTTTYLPEVNIALAVMRSGEEGRNTVLLDSRQLSADDFRSGNMIVISSPSACPWIHLLDDKLNFRYTRTFNTPESEFSFVNLHPMAGEEESYSAGSSIPQFGKSYAILARVPNLSNNGKILIIYGFKTSGIQAAGEYATDPRLAAELVRIFGVKGIRELPDFEVLLSTDSMASTPLNIHVVAHRIIK